MKLTIVKKLLIGFSLVIVIMVSLVIYNYNRISYLRDLQDEGATRASDAVKVEEEK